MSPKIVDATPELVAHFFGGKPPPWTIRAVIATIGDEPIALCGAFRYDDTFIFFSEGMAVMREKYRKTGVRMALQMMKVFRERRMTVYAQPSPSVESAKRFLEWLGFEPTGEGVYRWK